MYTIPDKKHKVRRYALNASVNELKQDFKECDYVETIRPVEHNEMRMYGSDSKYGYGGGTRNHSKLFVQESEGIYFLTDYGMQWLITPDTLIIGYERSPHVSS